MEDQWSGTAPPEQWTGGRDGQPAGVADRPAHVCTQSFEWGRGNDVGLGASLAPSAKVATPCRKTAVNHCIYLKPSQGRPAVFVGVAIDQRDKRHTERSSGTGNR